MSFETKIESGLQCVTRLIHRPSVQELDRDLFFKDLENSDIVEIQYANSSGATALLTKLIAKCLLPSTYNGLNMHVILINTENQFQVAQLAKVMSAEACDVQGPTNMSGLVKNLLMNFKIINCYNHQQVFLTLSSLDDLLLQNKKVGLVVIDSVLTLYTKQFNFTSKKQTREWLETQKLVRYELSLNVSENNLICTSKSGKDEKRIYYRVDNMGNMRTVKEPKKLNDL